LNNIEDTQGIKKEFMPETRRKDRSEDVLILKGYILPILLAIVSLSCYSESSKDSGLNNSFIRCGYMDSEAASS
jgi:hypothetical protein